MMNGWNRNKNKINEHLFIYDMHISIFLLFHGDGYLYEQSFPKYPVQHLQTLLKHTPLLLQLFGHIYN